MTRATADNPHLPPPADADKTGRLLHWLSIGGVYLFVAALLVLGRVISEDFWSGIELLKIVNDVAILGIVAVGMAFVTYSGHYVDLSIPGVMAISGIVAAAMLKPYGLTAAILSGLACGAALGAINGMFVGLFRLNPIIWTLAANSIIIGGTDWARGSKWTYIDSSSQVGAWFGQLYDGRVLGLVPLPVVLLALVVAGGHAAMRHTGFGKQLKLLGANYEAARLTGVNVRGRVMLAFMVCGLAAAMAGIIKTSLNKYGDVSVGLTYDFQAITAVVIGGMTLAGGRGNMIGVVGGVLVIGLLGRILPLIPGVGQDEQFIIRGVIFITVVALGMFALRRTGRDDA